MSTVAVAFDRPPRASGFCRRCRTTHTLPTGNAFNEAQRLMGCLEETGSIALHPDHADDPDLSTAPLFGDSRGKMLGVLECLERNGKIVWLYAFSGQYSGRWQVPGWAPPLFDVEQFHRLNNPEEKQIKKLTARIEKESEPGIVTRLKTDRTRRCRRLMADIHGLYVLNNFHGQKASLDDAAGTTRAKPTGIGDCCAPKLLNHAASRRLRPVSLAEFYFGRANRSHTRLHKHFYPPCTDKCEPLLGYLLCGS